MGVIGFLTPSNIHPYRFLAFGWLFGAIPLIFSILTINKKNIRYLGVAIIFLFCLYNLYQIPSDFYSAPNNVLEQPSIEDYSTAEKIDLSNGRIIAFENDVVVILDLYKNIPDSAYSTDRTFYDSLLQNQNYYDAIIVNEKNNKKILSDESSKRYYEKYLIFLDNTNAKPYYQKILNSSNITYYIKA